MAPERVQSITPEQLLKARLRAALGDLQDVVHDADLLPPEARQQVLTALGAIVEAIALVTAQDFVEHNTGDLVEQTSEKD
jgi:hypothetical protein